MRRNRQHIDIQIMDVQGQLSGSLHCVRMEERAALMGGLGQLRDGQYRTNFVVGEHQGDKHRIITQGGFQAIDGDAAVTLQRRKIQVDTVHMRQLHGSIAHSGMFNLAGDDVRARVPMPRVQNSPANSEVIALRTAACEHNFARFAVQNTRHNLARFFYGSLGFLRESMHARGIAVHIREIRQHGLHNTWINGGAGTVVKIN